MYLTYSQAMTALMQGFDVQREATGVVFTLDPVLRNMVSIWPDGTGNRSYAMTAEDTSAKDWIISHTNGKPMPRSLDHFDIFKPVKSDLEIRMDKLEGMLETLITKLDK
ncbi:MAG: hypothetical protein ACRDCE_20370 [Cetobacterium sp.]|uniref:hypothetical protein n=1 Tax=Cetobacterium sp. TaxID=2071632 RepID=UPI003EE791DD